MSHHYISLGAACNGAKMVKHIGLRRGSYPFDWLLNIDTGLSSVVDIIHDDFAKVSADDCYDVTHHPDVGRVVSVYKDYPQTFHIHSDPSGKPEHHSDLVRRYQRFRAILRSTDTLHFIYYRDLSWFRTMRPDISAAEVVDIMVEEAKSFFNTIDTMRHGKTHLLLVLESEVDQVVEAEDAIRNVTLSDKRMAFGRAVSRYDDDPVLHLRWQQEWFKLLVSKTHMPIRLQVKAYIKTRFRSFRNNLKGCVSAVSKQLSIS